MPKKPRCSVASVSVREPGSWEADAGACEVVAELAEAGCRHRMLILLCGRGSLTASWPLAPAWATGSCTPASGVGLSACVPLGMWGPHALPDGRVPMSTDPSVSPRCLAWGSLACMSDTSPSLLLGVHTGACSWSKPMMS